MILFIINSNTNSCSAYLNDQVHVQNHLPAITKFAALCYPKLIIVKAMIIQIYAILNSLCRKI